MSVDVSSVPQAFADRLGTTLFAGQILSTLIVLSLFLLPTVLLTKGKNPILSIVMAIMSMGLCVALGWCPYWFLIIVCMIIALMYSGTMRNWVSGRGD